MTKHTPQFMPSFTVTIRQLWQAEQGMLRDHFAQLDAASRAMRFGGQVHDSFIDLYVRSAFSTGNMVIGAFVDGQLVGIGELKLFTSQLSLHAEVAFSVIPAWQGQGIGDALITRIIAILQNRSISKAQIWCSSSNSRMQHLIEKHGAKLSFSDADEAKFEIELPWPMPSSFIEEITGEFACYTHAFMLAAQLTNRTVPATPLPS